MIRDLGTLHGSKYSEAAAINEHGQIIGQSGLNEQTSHAFLWQKGKMRDLSTLGGGESHAVAINETGQVIGWSYTRTQPNHSFLWQKGKMRDLGTLGGGEAEVSAINDSGQIVGSSAIKRKRENGENMWRAFLWQKGRMTILDPRYGGDSSEAVAINNRGQVIVNEGWPWESHAFLWAKGKLRALSTLGGRYANASAINEKGQVIGWSETGQKDAKGFSIRHGFLWQTGKMRDLGVLPGDAESGAVAINNRGQIVSSSTPPVDLAKTSGDRAFLWEQGTMRDLGAFDGARDLEVKALSERGQVVGFGASEDCGTAPGMAGAAIPHAFVWQNGTATGLPTLPRAVASQPGLGYPWDSMISTNSAINGHGQIVGWSTTGEGDYCTNQLRHAVLWTLKR